MGLCLRDKEDFLNYVLENCNFKRRESSWILHYLKNHSSKLSNIVFSNNVDFSKNYIIITEKGAEGFPFIYSNGEYKTTNVEEALKDIKNVSEKIYLEIYFKDVESEWKYYSVIEENPYFHSKIVLSIKERKEFDFYLTMLNEKFYREYLSSKIDESLDNRDRGKFLFYCTMLKEIDEKS